MSNYRGLLVEINGLLSASEREVFTTKAIIALCEKNDALLAALKAATGYMQNVAIDLQTGTPKQTTLDTLNGGLALARAAIAKAEPAA